MRRVTVGVTCVLALALTAANRSAVGEEQKTRGVRGSYEVSRQSPPASSEPEESATSAVPKHVLEMGRSPAGIAAAQAEEFSRRLFDLEYPELRRRDLRELDFLSSHVDVALLTYRSVDALKRVLAQGGGHQEHAQAGLHACDALADYCWAAYAVDRDQPLHAANAVNWSRRAVVFARRNLLAAEAKRQAQVREGTLNLVLGSQDSLLALSRKTIRAEEVAAVANVDISSVPTLEELVESSASRPPTQPPSSVRPTQPPGPPRPTDLLSVVSPPADPTSLWLPDRLPSLTLDPKTNSPTPVTPPPLKPAPSREPGAANPRKPVSEKGRSPTGSPAAQAEELSRRLFDLEYPELRRRDLRELEFLREHVEGAFQVYKGVAALARVGAEGGGAQKEAQTRTHACDALVDYCWAFYAADRDQPLHAANAVNWSRWAVLSSQRDLAAAQAKRRAQVRGGTLDLVLDSQDSLLARSRKTIRAEEIAAAANVDISSVPTLQGFPGSSTSRPPTQPPGPPRLADSQLRVAPPTDASTVWLLDKLPRLVMDPKTGLPSSKQPPVTPPALKRAPVTPPALKRAPTEESTPRRSPKPVPSPGVPNKPSR